MTMPKDHTTPKPAQRARTGAEVTSVHEGLAWACAAADLRVRVLAWGGLEALRWVEGTSAHAPFVVEDWPDPSLDDIVEVVGVATAIAEVYQGTPPQFRTDAQRLFARGVQEILLWWLHLGCRRPSWTVEGVDPATVAVECLGQVGADLDWAAESVSEHRFPYDPVTRLVPPAGAA
jgi:hypothetical protein